MALPDTRTNDELRACLRTGDAPDRVYAAFELGRRLGAEVTHDLDLPAQGDSGVRRHWLTILASFGEREAVRAIAEAHVGDPEGEHALHLAIQLGITEPPWLADRFNQTTERMQGALLDQGDDVLDWTRTVVTLESLLGSDFPDIRRRAIQRLLVLQPSPGQALRHFAIRAPAEAGPILAAWARGPDHRELLAHVPLIVVALRELLAAGRRYDLPTLRQMVLDCPPAFALLDELPGREPLLQLTDERLEAESARWLSSEWISALGQVLAPPWDADEKAVLDRWARAAQSWRVEPADSLDGFVDAESAEGAALRAVGYAVADGDTPR